MVIKLCIGEMNVMLLDGGPKYSPNASISLFIGLTDENEIEQTYHTLIEGGEALMPLGTYPWSQKYGWLKDKYGFTWQIMKMENSPTDMMVWPSILFANQNYGHAEAFFEKYTKLFKQSSILQIERYGSYQPEYEGKIMYSQFILSDTMMSAMDGPGDHQHDLTEGVSLVIECDTQAEIDQNWDGLLVGGGVESRCGWLKDQFGISWQVIPKILYDLMNNPVMAPNVGQALSKMVKLDIDTLIKASKTS
jgi:predicted 3-demethylubiquinone-9 3-methyltransferase (glyoxalase superfamily)